MTGARRRGPVIASVQDRKAKQRSGEPGRLPLLDTQGGITPSGPDFESSPGGRNTDQREGGRFWPRSRPSVCHQSAEMLRRLDIPHESPWLVVNTLPKREQLAIENLRRQGFTVYCPMVTKRIRHARRVTDAVRPLFPSYLFVDFASARHTWRRIMSTYGVRSVVRRADEPSLLDHAVIDALKSREVEGLIRKPDVPFAVGDKVVMQSGPLDGLIGQIIEMRENDRLVVLLGLLNQQVKLHVRAQSLAKG